MIHPAYIVRIDYTNYRGERAVRRVLPVTIYFGSTDYHPESQWLMVADDVEKNARRIFAMKDIHSWSADGVAFPGTDPAQLVKAWGVQMKRPEHIYRIASARSAGVMGPDGGKR